MTTLKLLTLYPRSDAAWSAGTSIACLNALSQTPPGLRAGSGIVITPGSVTLQPENRPRDAVRIQLSTLPVIWLSRLSEPLLSAPDQVSLSTRARSCPVGVAA